MTHDPTPDDPDALKRRLDCVEQMLEIQREELNAELNALRNVVEEALGKLSFVFGANGEFDKICDIEELLEGALGDE